MAAAKRAKPPVEKAEYQIGKQIEAIKASTLNDAQKAQLGDFFAGVQRVLQVLDPVIDPSNPPSPDSVYGKLIALGRSQRALGEMLIPAAAGSGSGDGSGEGAEERKPEMADVGI